MAKKENKYTGYDITTQAIHTGTDYDMETGAVRRPLHMANMQEMGIPISTGWKKRSRLCTMRKIPLYWRAELGHCMLCFGHFWSPGTGSCILM